MLDKGLSAHLQLLAWYRSMGVDQPVGETPIDWLSRGDLAPGHAFRLATAPHPVAAASAVPAPGVARPATPRPALPVQQRQFPATAPDAAVMSARGLAKDAKSLSELEATLARFDGCSLKATAKSLCFYRGAAKARLMLVGEAPGRDEDLQGKPFVGRAGQLLDKMLAAIGLSEQDAHITNIVYWRPPGNRTPTPQEAQVCRPFLERQIELVAPDVMVLLGGAAAKHILDVPEGIMRVRGKFRDVVIGSCTVRAIATLHPAYLLRTPAAKRLAWRDLLAVKAALNG
jgi:uracil-DNA glycosylase